MSAVSGPIRLLICGGRNFSDRWAVWQQLDMMHLRGGIACIICGGAPGADRLAAEWAKTAGVELHEFPADWATYGRSAGPRRNREMLAIGKPDEVLAFPGGAGTADMIRAATAASIHVVKYINDEGA